MPDSDDTRQERKDPNSFGPEVGTSLKREARTWLRFAAWGAGLAATALATAGFWFFGLTGLAVGAVIGAVGVGSGPGSCI